MALIGSFIDKRYQVRKALGAGGMATVYLADDVIDGHKVALKVLSKEQIDASGGSLLKRFQREFNACAKLDHPNIVKLYQIGQIAGGHWYYSMEYLPTPDLDSILTKHKKIDEKRTLHIVRQIASAFCCFHDKGVFHRDLKPGNIMLCKSGRVVLVDFGLAKDENITAMTATGSIIGTPLYMAPETIIGDKSDHRTDIFALGVMTYEMLTGTHPFKAKDIQTLAARLLKEKEKPVTALNNELTPEWDDFISQSLAKDKEERYQSGLEIEEDLELIHQVLHGAPTAEKTRRLHRERLQKRLKLRQKESAKSPKNKEVKITTVRPSGPTDVSTATSPVKGKQEQSQQTASAKRSRSFIPIVSVVLGALLFLILYLSRSGPVAYSSIEMKTEPFPGGFVATWRSHHAYPTVIELLGKNRRILTGDFGKPVTDHELTITGLAEGKEAAFRIIYPSGETSLEKSAITGALDFSILECKKQGDELQLTFSANLADDEASCILLVGDRAPLEVIKNANGKWQTKLQMRHCRRPEIFVKFTNSKAMSWKVNLIEKLSQQLRRLGAKMSTVTPPNVIRKVKDKVDKDMIPATKEYKEKHNKETLATQELLDIRFQLLADNLSAHLKDVGFTRHYDQACALAPLAFSHQQIPLKSKYQVYRSMMEMVRYALYTRVENQKRPLVISKLPYLGDFATTPLPNKVPQKVIVVYEATDEPYFIGTPTPAMYRRPNPRLNCQANIIYSPSTDLAQLVITHKTFDHFTVNIKINDEYSLLWYDRPFSGNKKSAKFIKRYQRLPKDSLRQGQNKIDLIVERLFDSTLERRTSIKAIELELY